MLDSNGSNTTAVAAVVKIEETLGDMKGKNVLILAGTKISDDGLKTVKALPDLERLDLSGDDVTDEGLKHLKGLKKIRELNLAGTPVTDRGLGIAAEHQERVFERFYGDGSGLGLAIVRAVVEAHDGTVALERTPLGRGTRFVIRLPAAAGRSSAPVAAEQYPTSA